MSETLSDLTAEELAELRERHVGLIEQVEPDAQIRYCAVCCDEGGDPLDWPCQTIRLVADLDQARGESKRLTAELERLRAGEGVSEALSAAKLKTRELDARVAVKVCGWTRLRWDGATPVAFNPAGSPPGTEAVPRFAADMYWAWEVVEAMTQRGYLLLVVQVSSSGWQAQFGQDNIYTRPSGWSDAPTLPEAICRAALAALEVTT